MNWEAFDKMIGDVLADNPTTEQNQDMIMAIEGSMTTELGEEVFMGYISREEAEVVLYAFHKRIHPET